MGRSIAGRDLKYWLNLLASMLYGHNNSGTPLRDDLKTELEEANTSFPALMNDYSTIRIRKRNVLRECRALQKAERRAGHAPGCTI